MCLSFIRNRDIDFRFFSLKRYYVYLGFLGGYSALSQPLGVNPDLAHMHIDTSLTDSQPQTSITSINHMMDSMERASYE